MLVIAVDNQISLRVVEKLKRKYKVVVWAGNKPDDVWIEEALDLGANIFISPDLDVPNYLDKLNANWTKWIDVPQKMTKEKQYEFLLKKLKE